MKSAKKAITLKLIKCKFKVVCVLLGYDTIWRNFDIYLLIHTASQPRRTTMTSSLA
jgi:hypothetical protein